ncbi:hypothetical protein [Micromonospora zhanjiangensis]|uniref:Uncharacterized protein n=1 Tax=Micromonospora zhanjiangensis TaxID=1522057 RepID=A0ABV8KHS7_9ACTN
MLGIKYAHDSMCRMANLDHAVKAYRASLAAVEAAKQEAERRVKESREQVAVRRAELAAAIVEAARDGVRQVDIIRATGYSRERVRSILRAGGVEPE